MYPVLVHKVAGSWRVGKRCDRDEIEARDLSASERRPSAGADVAIRAGLWLWPDDAQSPHRRDE